MAERDFLQIMKWFDFRLITISLSKTSYMAFTETSKCNSISVSVDGTPTNIHSASSIQYLGLQVACHLKWNIHINFVEEEIRTIL